MSGNESHGSYNWQDMATLQTASMQPSPPLRSPLICWLLPLPIACRTCGILCSRRHSLQVVAAEKKKYGSFEEMLAGSEVPLLVDFYATCTSVGCWSKGISMPQSCLDCAFQPIMQACAAAQGSSRQRNNRVSHIQELVLTLAIMLLTCPAARVPQGVDPARCWHPLCLRCPNASRGAFRCARVRCKLADGPQWNAVLLSRYIVTERGWQECKRKALRCG